MTGSSIPRLLLGSLALCMAGHATTAHGVQVSASYDPIQTVTTGMSPSVGPRTTPIFDPGVPQFSGAASLAAPAPLLTVTDTVGFAYPASAPNPGNPVQMYGDAISSITNLGANSYQLDLTLTNFWIESSGATFVQEYVYLNIWETFTGLNLATAVTGNAAVSGLAFAGPVASVPGDFAGIEPIVNVFDPNTNTWTNGSLFFGDNTGYGPNALVPLSAGTPVFPLVGFVSAGGDLTIGLETILMLSDFSGTGSYLHLPSSLHLSLIVTTVPEPSTLVSIGLGLACLMLARFAHQTRRTKE